jgi:hypothetical protein
MREPAGRDFDELSHGAGRSAPREPILVQDFNNRPGETFKVYYSLDAPPQAAPCHDSRPDIGGWVCR